MKRKLNTLYRNVIVTLMVTVCFDLNLDINNEVLLIKHKTNDTLEILVSVIKYVICHIFGRCFGRMLSKGGLTFVI